MGSYLTIVNDTPDTWQCKVGPDMHALKISSIIIGVIGAAMTALAITGTALALISLTAIPIAALAGVGLSVALPALALGSGLAASMGFPIAAAADAIFFVSGLPVAALVAGAGMSAAGVVAGVTGGAAAAAGVGAGMANMAGMTTFGIAVMEAIKKKLHLKGYDTILPGDSHRYGRMTLSLWQQSVCMKTNTSGPYVVVDTVVMRPIFSGSTPNSNRNHTIQYWINKHGITSKYTIEGKSGNKTRHLEEHDETIEHYKFFSNGTVLNTDTRVMYTP